MASRFLEGRAHQNRTASPNQAQPDQNARPDRSGAHNLKVKVGKKPSITAAAPTFHSAPHLGSHVRQAPATHVPAPDHRVGDIFDAHEHYQDRRPKSPEPYDLPPNGMQNNIGIWNAGVQRAAFDDTTVGSEFDHTKSEVVPEPEQLDDDIDLLMDEDRGFTNEDRRARIEFPSKQGVPAHSLNHKQTMYNPPAKGPNLEPVISKPHSTPGITGRFTANKKTRQIEDLQFRNGHGKPLVGHNDQGTKKRSRSGDAAHGSKTLTAMTHFSSDDEDDDLESPEDDLVLSRDDFAAKHNVQINSDRTEQPDPVRSRKSRTMPQSQPISSQRLQVPEQQEEEDGRETDDRRVPYYGDEELQAMTYKALKEEDFEAIPIPQEFEYPARISGPSVTLEERLEYYVTRDEKEQAPFFENLSNDAWEQAGDWFIERFTEFMTGLKKKRQAKRTVAADYEAEVEKRERLVRAHANKYDKEFNDMAGIGKNLLRNKTV
ncbi:hypothetical protein BUE80_DR008102 [Diplocarpon rosae]|nr:hypothetical protein BUE80_DR008102 [Diplocarpon rosae]